MLLTSDNGAVLDDGDDGVPLLFVALGAAHGAAPRRAVAFVDHDLLEPFGVDFDEAGRAYIVQMGGNRVSVLDEKRSPERAGGNWREGARAATVGLRCGRSSTGRTTCS